MKRALTLLTAFLLLLPILLFVPPLGASALSVIQPYPISSYNAYLSYLEDNEPLPDNFVTYDNIKSFGKFLSYRDSRIYSYTSNAPIEYSYYTFRDPNNFQIDLLIRYSSKINIGGDHYLLQANGMTSMRHLQSSKTGSILRGNLEYVYQDGTLINILWKVGSVTFALGGDRPLAQYPTDKEQTFVSDLLSIDEATANTALQALMKDVPGAVAPAHDLTAYIFRRLLWIGILAIAAFCIIRPIVKKRKAKPARST